MTEQELKKALARGLDYIDKADNLAKRTVRKLAKDKGFKNYKCFDAQYTGDFDILVNVNGFGGAAELSVVEMFDLTKEEIRDVFLNDSYINDETKTEIEKLLK